MLPQALPFGILNLHTRMRVFGQRVSLQVPSLYFLQMLDPRFVFNTMPPEAVGRSTPGERSRLLPRSNGYRL